MAGNPYLRFPLGELHVNSLLLWGILAIFLIAYCVVSSILVYHWRAYGMDTKAVALAQVIFFVVSALLFVAAMLAISAF